MRWSKLRQLVRKRFAGSISDALKSRNPFVQCLAVMDSRLGRRTLEKIFVEGLQELARRLYVIRCEAENLAGWDHG